jgi:hypothetical protein
MFGLKSYKFVRMDLRVLFWSYLKLNVNFCCDLSGYRNYTSQVLHSYIVDPVTHLDERK